MTTENTGGDGALRRRRAKSKGERDAQEVALAGKIQRISDAIRNRLVRELSAVPRFLVVDPSAGSAISSLLAETDVSIHPPIICAVMHPGELTCCDEDVWLICVRIDTTSYDAVSAVRRLAGTYKRAELVGRLGASHAMPMGQLYDLGMRYVLREGTIKTQLPIIAQSVAYERATLLDRLHRVALREQVACRLGDAALRFLHFETRLDACATLQQVEREAIKRALQAASGCRKAAAERLGISRGTLYRKLGAYGLDEYMHT